MVGASGGGYGINGIPSLILQRRLCFEPGHWGLVKRCHGVGVRVGLASGAVDRVPLGCVGVPGHDEWLVQGVSRRLRPAWKMAYRLTDARRFLRMDDDRCQMPSEWQCRVERDGRRGRGMLELKQCP